MGLIKCKDCGAEISEDCTTCPNCGADIRKQQNPNLSKQNGCGTVIFSTFTLLMAIGGFSVLDGADDGIFIFLKFMTVTFIMIPSAIGILIGIIKMLK